MSPHDAVDGSLHWHLGAMMVAVEVTIERGVDGALSQIDLDEEFAT